MSLWQPLQRASPSTSAQTTSAARHFSTIQDGTVIGIADWEPFGALHATTSPQALNLRFPGQWFGGESGLHQNWMRDYDPTTGRYIQGDPLGLVDGASVYGYAR
ncbi:RHS repeat-associated core domain-containing protein [Amylibacter sp. SFDW26]|uniref:RHS repeat-associated core domain-containing protein n=1 Tax=Amylibacter sp. SFDW26 TaxID=2652722 RepID=UPI0012623D87|nr:RHS repeat-associated core domain-containing protein [Amylibacter sp. SFDW26]